MISQKSSILESVAEFTVKDNLRLQEKANRNRKVETILVKKRYNVADKTNKEEFKRSYIKACDEIIDEVKRLSIDHFVICNGGHSFYDVDGGLISLQLIMLPRVEFEMTAVELLAEAAKNMLATPA